ncbi:MAG: chemotaxis protein CheC [Haloferacaceae archaeon]
MSLEIDVRKLRLFNQMAKEGGGTVADHLQQMTGLETELYVTKLNFLDRADIRTHVGDSKQIGISIELLEPPHGHILFLFDGQSAKRIAGHMIGGMGEVPDSGFSELEQSAIQEIGNIMTSAFIDGWANVLDTTIDISTPSITYGPGSSLVSNLVHSQYDMALLFDSQIHAPAADVDLSVYMFPNLEELVHLMRQIELD